MRTKAGAISPLMDLFFCVTEQLGFSSDREIADLADVTVENVANWRSGAVQEFKAQKLKTIKDRLAMHMFFLREQARLVDVSFSLGVSSIEIEAGSGPADLQRQLRDRIPYDYLGHRFLYFDPQGALAWENLIRGGYEQDIWLHRVEACAAAWLDPGKDGGGRTKGPIAAALGLGRAGKSLGLDVVSLGPGDGDKEMIILRQLLGLEPVAQRCLWLSFVPVDVSIPLLLTASNAARALFAEAAQKTGVLVRYMVLPFCADFEEGKLSFRSRLPTTLHGEVTGRRLILMLGNTFGNLRDEEVFVRQKLGAITRPGDLVWLEVGLRSDPMDSDPLFRMTIPNREETSSETNRRLLLEGPYRRWESATGRAPSAAEIRVRLREDDDSSRVPGSCNFCHDLVLRDERRTCTMLYSRRYELKSLVSWFERMQYHPLGVMPVEDSKGRPRVGHLLLEKR